ASARQSTVAGEAKSLFWGATVAWWEAPCVVPGSPPAFSRRHSTCWKSLPMDEEALQDLAHRFVTRGVRGRVADKRPSERGPEAMVEHYARRAALRGFVFGLPGGPLALLLGVLDASSSLRLRTELAAALLSRSDSQFFERSEWRAQVVRTAYGLPEEGAHLKGLALRS